MSAVTQAVLRSLASKSAFANQVVNTARINLTKDEDLISDDQKLDIFNDAMQSASQLPSQTDPAVGAVPQTPVQVSSRRQPERQAVTVAQQVEVAKTPPPEVVAAPQAEVEKSGEIPPEVSEYLSRVEDHTETLPQEIVIDGSQMTVKPANIPVTPVVVVPITPEIEKESRGKNPTFSIAWLVEWSHRIIKMFVGKVIYRPATQMAEK